MTLLGSSPTRLLRHVPLVLGAVLMLFPLWWMLVVSLETEQRAGMAMLGGDVVQVWPQDPQWHNYTDAMREVGSVPWISFLDALANSIVVTVLVIIGTVLSCSLVGFAFARIRFRGRGWMFLLMLATMMLPAQVTMIPLFLLFRSMGWVDTLLPLIVPAFFGSAFNIFLYRQFIAGIPEALLEAGRLDGLGWLGLWWRIVLPMCTPVTAIVAVFSFIYTWNDFMSPLIYLHSESNYTLAIALNSFRTQYAGLEDVHLLLALSVVTMIPCILLFLAAQKQFIEGLGSGAVKG
ncbi:MAG: carbohydrate ABC transporter permease [Phycisphaerales bacterium]|jgi:ABC-type glycerol-3-phosphate transport system permease component|nr:carbohydrate ABC transporter permease [Phycisphaerales bacterium]MDP6311497.1 carbohydrate ABC transporter permease [Phycisphaerales bacterium]MDP7086388.1 carbohydrate ABC transporter permease [Phycisphaerales bacterium]MDP7189497.1 carbohydrate ABC transporter permease [Phycisphaerales bacterium]MDP7519296.1 carbohydrate ABC transporter permease [Phycisphaerales bacterium]|tara:strand:- start:15 stop:887 length:873 start_codon:yes stop_codon:yes gene_type:complete